jgi:urea transport system permease protein
MTLETPIDSLVEPRKSRQKKQQRALWIEIGAAIAIVLILLVVVPLVLSDFRLKLLGRILALAITALGMDLIWGYTGLLSLGHGMFFALGGYAFAMYLNLQLPNGQIPEFFSLYGVANLPWFWQPFYSFPFTVVAIFVIPAIVAGLLGYLIFRNRIRGVYFSILTQAALVVFFNFFNGQQELINGTNGLKTDTATVFGVLASSPRAQFIFYVLTVLSLAGAYALCRWLTSGRFGRLLVSIRDDENRVRFSGYNPTGFKVLVFAVSGSLAGISGAFYTVQSGIINPDVMLVPFSIEMVIWVAVGGRGTLVGAIMGTLLVQYARVYLSESLPMVWQFFQGAIFLIVVLFLPGGLVEAFAKVRSLVYRPRLVTYPSLELAPETQEERGSFEASELRDR